MLRFEEMPELATRLSYRRGAGAWCGGLFSALARLSLVGLTASMSFGCLIEDPPPYTQPAKTPPRLDLKGATPPLDQVIVRKRGDVIQFRMPVASEDAGDPIQGVLLLDYAGESAPDVMNFGKVAPSTLDDQDRALTISWPVRRSLAPGCHRFTLVVSHFSNFVQEVSHQVIDKGDTAEAYWWANIDPETESNTLVNCPLASSGGT